MTDQKSAKPAAEAVNGLQRDDRLGQQINFVAGASPLNCGKAYGYRLIAAGELESYRNGRARKMTVASIRRYIERRLTDGGSS